MGSTGSTFAFNDAQGVTTDCVGNVYVVGTFGRSGDTAHFGTHSITSATSSAIFAAKFSPTAGWLWATAVDPGSPLSVYQGTSIVIDALGCVDIVGTLSGLGTSSSIVVSQLDPGTGAISWTRFFTGGLGVGAGMGTGITAQGVQNSPKPSQTPLLDITGTIFGTINFAGPVTSAGSSDLFVGQLTEAGTPVWGRALSISTISYASGSGITVDEARGQIFAVGTEETPRGSSSLLVAKYNSITGTLVRSATPIRVSSSEGTAITVDGRGHLYVTGTGPARLGSAVVAKLGETSLGTIWTHNFVASASGSVQPTGIAVDKQGDPFVTGGFSGSVNFGAGTLRSKGSPSFMAKLRAGTGLARWSAAGGPGDDFAVGIAYDPRTISKVYIAGDFNPPATFGTTTLGGVLGSANSFLAWLR